MSRTSSCRWHDKIGNTRVQRRPATRARKTIDELNELPIKTINGTTTYIRDVAWVRNGYPAQTNIARVDGLRSVLLTIQEGGPRIDARCHAGDQEAAAGRPSPALPHPSSKVTPLNDQSVFVRGAVMGVVREALIAAA